MALLTCEKQPAGASQKGYLTSDGVWHSHDEDSGYISDALRNYEVLQFANLFDPHVHKQAFVNG